MINRRTWLLLVGPLVILAMAAVPTVGWLYFQGGKHIGSDYTAFTGNLVRAQHEVIRFRQTANDLVNTVDSAVHRDRLQEMIPMLENRRDTVLNGLANTAPTNDLIEFAQNELNALTPQLDSMGQTLQELSLDDDAAVTDARRQALALEADLAFVYSELHEAIHQAAADYKQFTQALSLTILFLVIILLLFTLALVASLIKVFRQRSALQALAVTDSQTGLFNRRAFENAAEEALLKSSRSKTPLSVAIIDVDHFKSINDRYGHPAGDAVLIKLARILDTVVRQSDTLARLGGEEFGIIMPDTDAEGARRLGERLREAVAKTAIHLNKNDAETLTISLGIATLSPDQREARDLAALYSLADDALYQAKTQGRNRIYVSVPA